ncbi:hypothetical protein [Romboutsia sp.]|uniref:hypothetical protein n=1 Tax=Romboutsia sp. TaxID=1965302 RepID=UPI003F2CE9A7
MINRIIYSNKVYYKVKDLVEVYDNKFSLYKIKKVMKEQGIATTKLKGYGNALFIEETNIAMIEIEGAITVMETKFKDRKQSLKSEINMASLSNFMFRDMLPIKSNEEMIKEVLEKVDESMDKPIKFEEDNLKKDRGIQPLELNEVLSKNGIEERFIGVELLYEDRCRSTMRTSTIGVLINNNDDVLSDSHILNMNGYNERLLEDLSSGKVCVDEPCYDNEDEMYEQIHYGNAKQRTKEDVIKIIFEKVLTKDDYIDEDDWIVVKLDNDRCMSVDKDLLLCILRNKFKIIEVYGCNEDVVDSEEKDIIDVNYTEIEEQEIMEQGIKIAETTLGKDIVEEINNLDEEETEVEYKNIYEKIKARAEKNKRKFREE